MNRKFKEETRTFVCPFYLKGSEGGRMRCEGGCVDLPSITGQVRFQSRYCLEGGRWQECPLAQTLEEICSRQPRTYEASHRLCREEKP